MALLLNKYPNKIIDEQFNNVLSKFGIDEPLTLTNYNRSRQKFNMKFIQFNITFVQFTMEFIRFNIKFVQFTIKLIRFNIKSVQLKICST
ncbi:unnamed protein product [Rotaria magnacalcarata]|uniref:Uncharacterized protein n=1 Tax=Rotaria magnacalcarata TaxID=392030 RepID=A0A8S3BHR6_9BILA|nr:unnamed protein product [Rotaria magnacalcarata]